MITVEEKETTASTDLPDNENLRNNSSFGGIMNSTANLSTLERAPIEIFDVTLPSTSNNSDDEYDGDK